MATSLLEPGLLLTVCGIDELAGHRDARASHVLSILDPDWPEPPALRQYDTHHRLTLRFHDIIAPRSAELLPEPGDVQAVIAFGQELDGAGPGLRHLLVHCHAGISRSTAALATLLARHTPMGEEASIFARLRTIRPIAWPNSRMIAFADDLLGRGGRLNAALREHYLIQAAARPDFVRQIELLGRAAEVPPAHRRA